MTSDVTYCISGPGRRPRYKSYALQTCEPSNQSIKTAFKVSPSIRKIFQKDNPIKWVHICRNSITVILYITHKACIFHGGYTPFTVYDSLVLCTLRNKPRIFFWVTINMRLSSSCIANMKRDDYVHSRDGYMNQPDGFRVGKATQ